MPAAFVYAISVPSPENDGSLAPLTIGARPLPSGLIVQMFVPQLNAITPFAPANVPPCAAESSAKPAVTTVSEIRALRIGRCTRVLYRLAYMRAAATVARGGTNPTSPCRCRAREVRDRAPTSV